MASLKLSFASSLFGRASELLERQTFSFSTTVRADSFGGYGLEADAVDLLSKAPMTTN